MTKTLVATPDPDPTEVSISFTVAHFDGDQNVFDHFVKTLSQAWADNDPVVITYGAYQYTAPFKMSISE